MGGAELIRRSVTRTVVVRPARTRVICESAANLTCPSSGSAPLPWYRSPRAIALYGRTPKRRNDDWVDMNFGVDQRGDALLLAIDGRARLDFAEVEFENGQAQVVDFNEGTHSSGLYPLLNFADGRRVMNVRLLAKSETPRTKFTVYLEK